MKSRNLNILKILYIFFLCGCSHQHYTLLNEVNSDERNELNKQSIEMAKDIMRKYCFRKDPNRIKYGSKNYSSPRPEYRIHDLDNMVFVPIPLFEVTKEAQNYSSEFVNYLKLNKKELLSFYTIKDNKLEGFFDWIGVYNYYLTKDCSYLKGDNFLKFGHPFWLGYNYLLENKRDTSFLFGVKYFLSALWFIENNKVFILDLREMKIYDDVDEFIKLKCEDGFIQSIANGGQVHCNL